eukprot:scaffold1026_cov409-Prasinococcus_capsulatus_cf.AAC.15
MNDRGDPCRRTVTRVGAAGACDAGPRLGGSRYSTLDAYRSREFSSTRPPRRGPAVERRAVHLARAEWTAAACRCAGRVVGCVRCPQGAGRYRRCGRRGTSALATTPAGPRPGLLQVGHARWFDSRAGSSSVAVVVAQVLRPGESCPRCLPRIRLGARRRALSLEVL